MSKDRMSPEATARRLRAASSPDRLQDMIVTLAARLDEIARSLAAETPDALKLWVVLTATGMPVVLDVSEDGYASSPRVASIETATRMCSKDARILAASMRDENGHRGRAYPLGLGYTVVRAELERTIEILQGGHQH